MAVSYTAASVTRCTWRIAKCVGAASVAAPPSIESARRVVLSPLPAALTASEEIEGKGRTMRAQIPYLTGESIVAEQPIVVGHCGTTRCPGCLAPTDCATCRWAAAANRVRNAVQWREHLCQQVDTLPVASRANHVRVVCLLTLVIQAVADTRLMEWLLTSLRSSRERPDPDAPHVASTMKFATKFSAVMSAPQGLEPAQWTLTLFRLLMRLQVRDGGAPLVVAAPRPPPTTADRLWVGAL